MRNFDLTQQFKAISKSATDAIQSIFPVEGKIRTIRLAGVTVEDKLDSTDYAAQSKVKLKEGTWGVPVYASLELVENATGKVLDRAAKVQLFTLPKPTDRFSYIVGGNEYQVISQLRLKPGVYTLRKQNGELKTQVNLAKGKNFDLGFDDRSGTFSIQKVGGGQANIPLYPILVHLGVSPSAIGKAWGTQLEQANRGTDPKSVSRAESAFGLKPGTLKDYLSGTQISPETTKVVLGQGFDKVDGPLLLASSKHLLDVHMGRKEPVDRDALEFKDLHSIEDYIQERLQKNKNTLAFKLKRNIDNVRRTKLSQLVNPGAFSSVVESFFTQDDKASTPEQTNPVEMLSGQFKTTIMGSGGIKQEHAITPEMRNIHPSHYGFLDPVHTPESKRIGANLSLPIGAVKDGKELKSTVIDKSGKIAHLSPIEAYNKYIAFPSQKGDKIQAMYQGKVVEIPRSKVDYTTPSPSYLFSWSTNLVPYLPSNQGNRAMMASKQIEQAISLKYREAPLVQVGAAAGKSMEGLLGDKMVVRSPEDGVVTAVTPDHMTVKTKNGEARLNLYNNFSLNRKSFINHEVKVKVGDRVKAGQILADTNFTKDGALAIGTNMRVAYLPYKGLNFEDGIVISQSAAKKLTSEHIHKKSFDFNDTNVLGIRAFSAFYPNGISPDNLKKLAADGVVKKGQVVKQGDVVLVALQKKMPSASLGLVHKALSDRPKDVSLYWTLEDSGTVIDVQKSSSNITIFIKTEEAAKIGDKLAGRMGNKGIITKILADHEVPHDAGGKPVDVLLNPHGVISRINIGQIYESASGKVALKKGQPHIVQNFSGENYLRTTRDLLKKNGVEDKEELFDPSSGKSLGKVHVGNPYILKLFKQGTVNFSVRQGGAGHAYDANYQPLKAGGEEGAKTMDLLTVYSMLSHGARANLREMVASKSNQNDEFWRAVKSGQQIPPPQSPFVYDKFIAYLKGAGVDVKKEGSKLTLAPFTDKQIQAVSNGEIQKSQLYRAKDMKPVPGGFFDPVLTGGFNGNKWTHVELQEPVVNPVFEKAVRKLTDLGTKFDQIMSGKLYLATDGTFNTEGKGVTGGKAVEKLLKKIDVDKEVAALKQKAVRAREDKLDDINKRLRYLQALKDNKLRPEEAYMRKFVPIVPPAYRPVYPLPDGNVTASDVNYIYHNIGILNDMHKLPVVGLLPEEEKALLRKDIYQHVKGVSGLTDLNIRGRERAGFISEIKGGPGGQPKEGFFISKLLSKKQDYVGRGTIIPEPDLGIDQMAMPEEMAWKIFEPFLIRELKNMGKSPLQAKEEIKGKTALAKKALDVVMQERHVLLNRAPSLHKFSIMAFKPTLTTGRAIKIPPLVVKGFNADFDGDTMTVHVPITEEANREAAKMLPSANLFQPGTGKLMIAPSQEAQIGMFYLSKTPAGLKELNKIVPAKYAVKTILDKKETARLLAALAKDLPNNEFARIVAALKKSGEGHAYDRGFTLGLDDLPDVSKARDLIVSAARDQARKSTTEDQLSKLNTKATNLIDKVLEKKMKGKNNPLYDMVESGARGDKSQLRSIMATPLFVSDARNRIVASPIKKSYAEGLDVSDYWISMYGARRGMMDRAIQTSEPGAFSKNIMATTIDNVISAADCGTKNGVTEKIDNQDALHRFLAGDQGGLKHNTLVDTKAVARLKKAGLATIKVRSPLTCQKSKGTCSRCYGLDEHSKMPDLGDNIGAKAGQTLSEPLTQLLMNSFHTGGVAGTGTSVNTYYRINQLLSIQKEIKGSSPLAPVSGKVTKIEPGVAGGFKVTVGEKTVYVPKGNALKVSVGSAVAAGDALAEGAIKPQDLVKYKGMLPAQQYLVDELQKAYGAQGVGIQKRVFETVVRSLANTTRVLNNPKDSSHLPGDIISYTSAQAYNQNLVGLKPTEESVGYKLAETYGGFKKGHVLTDKDAKVIKGLGHKEVSVQKDPIIHAPLLKGISTLPLMRRDWMSALSYRNLAKAITEGASQGWETDVSSYHPVPALAHAASFGQGKDGKY